MRAAKLPFRLRFYRQVADTFACRREQRIGQGRKIGRKRGGNWLSRDDEGALGAIQRCPFGIYTELVSAIIAAPPDDARRTARDGELRRGSAGKAVFQINEIG